MTVNNKMGTLAAMPVVGRQMSAPHESLKILTKLNFRFPAPLATEVSKAFQH